MTWLVTSIAVSNLDELRSLAPKAWDAGAEAVELRIDRFEDEPPGLATYLKEHRDHRWIITCRSSAEGGSFDGDTMERVAILIAGARGTGAFVDFELADWTRSANIRKKVQLAAGRSDGKGYRLILSTHDFDDLPANLDELVAKMLSVDGVIAGKIAFRAKHICDSFKALDLMNEHSARVCAIAMGEVGLWTRVLARKLGALATFCSLNAESTTAPGQPTLEEMIHRYRWSHIDSSTLVYGVIGDPVSHSMSPLLFNHWFARDRVNAVYLPLRVDHADDGVQRFLIECRKRSWLDVTGLSVTIPHKIGVLDWAGDGADSMTRKIGAANTLTFRDGKIEARNTDCHAAISSITNALGCSRADLAGIPVDVLGAGGAARAIVCGLASFGCDVTVYGRSPEKTKGFADRYGVRPADWESRENRSGKILINCTSVGMWPHANASPMAKDRLGGCTLVLDVIYNPSPTQLLSDAAAAGCKTLDGLDMFVRQAAMQYELWTGAAPGTQDASSLIRDELDRQSEPHP